ncbi:MAG: phosphohistidine phosphatase SixA [Phycisphaerales bacterium JB063]
MKVLIFRHGIAEPRIDGLDDPNRQLTRQGYGRTQLAVIGLTRLMRPVDLILTSPYTRAEQTAKVLGLAMRRTPETLDALAADRPARDTIDAILHRVDTSIALVGHNPQLEEIVTLLCGRDPRRKLTPISKAGAVLLRVKRYPEKPATLQWAMSPRVLRMLARRLPRQRPPFPMSKTDIEPLPPEPAPTPQPTPPAPASPPHDPPADHTPPAPQ